MRRRDYAACRVNITGVCITVLGPAWEIVALGSESGSPSHLRGGARWRYAAGGQNS
jgi:hypothetical protein